MLHVTASLLSFVFLLQPNYYTADKQGKLVDKQKVNKAQIKKSHCSTTETETIRREKKENDVQFAE